MSILGYEDDAKKIYAHPELIQRFKVTLGVVKETLPSSAKGNAFYKSIMPFFEEFNVQNGYQAHSEAEITDKGNALFSSIQSGLERGKKNSSGRKYAAALLAWLCWKDPDEAKKFYDSVYSHYRKIGRADELENFQFREYVGEPAEFVEPWAAQKLDSADNQGYEKISSFVAALNSRISSLVWWQKLSGGLAIFLTIILGIPAVYTMFWGGETMRLVVDCSNL